MLPRALGLPRDPVEAARTLRSGRTRRISLGRANGRRFAFAAGLGLDAELVRRMDARGRSVDGKRPGDAVFAWTAVKTLVERRVRFDPALEVAGHGRAAFALVANTDPYTYLGRLPLQAAARGEFRRGARSGRAAVAPRAQSSGRSPLPRHRAHAPAAPRAPRRGQIELRCDVPLPFQLDGEDVGDVAEVVFEAERDAVAPLVCL